MKRHLPWLDFNRKPLAPGGLWTIPTAAALSQLSACGSDPLKQAMLAGIRDNASLLLIENNFSVEEDEHPRIPGPTLHNMLVSDPILETSIHKFSIHAMRFSYSPYSCFKVGAAILTNRQEIIFPPTWMRRPRTLSAA